MNTDTFESLANEIEVYAREFPAEPTNDPDADPDSDEFADGLAEFEKRAMDLYRLYRDAGAYAFRRPRKSFAVLRQALARARPNAFDIPTVAQGKDGAPPPQWAIEDACACRELAKMAAGVPVPSASRQTLQPEPVARRRKPPPDWYRQAWELAQASPGKSQTELAVVVSRGLGRTISQQAFSDAVRKWRAHLDRSGINVAESASPSKRPRTTATDPGTLSRLVEQDRTGFSRARKLIVTHVLDGVTGFDDGADNP